LVAPVIAPTTAERLQAEVFLAVAMADRHRAAALLAAALAVIRRDLTQVDLLPTEIMVVLLQVAALEAIRLDLTPADRRRMVASAETMAVV
jgi:hypothetical protein